MSALSEIIAKLEPNESIRFEVQLRDIRVLLKKGDHPKNNKSYQIFVSRSEVENPDRSIDVLAFEVDRALNVIRRQP